MKDDMQMAHKYKLKVVWSKRDNWNINILAINTEVISIFLPKQEAEDDFIVKVSIELMERNVKEVKTDFLAKAYNKYDNLNGVV